MRHNWNSASIFLLILICYGQAVVHPADDAGHRGQVAAGFTSEHDLKRKTLAPAHFGRFPAPVALRKNIRATLRPDPRPCRRGQIFRRAEDDKDSRRVSRKPHPFRRGGADQEGICRSGRPGADPREPRNPHRELGRSPGAAFRAADALRPSRVPPLIGMPDFCLFPPP